MSLWLFGDRKKGKPRLRYSIGFHPIYTPLFIGLGVALIVLPLVPIIRRLFR